MGDLGGVRGLGWVGRWGEVGWWVRLDSGLNRIVSEAPLDSRPHRIVSEVPSDSELYRSVGSKRVN